MIFFIFNMATRKFKVNICGGAGMAQLIEHLTLTQVTISQFMSLSPMLGSVLTAQSLEPASDSVSPSLSAPPQLACVRTLSHSQK